MRTIVVSLECEFAPADPLPPHAEERVPRLELVFALAAAGSAIIACTAGLHRLEDVRFAAASLGALVAVPLGTLARWCARPAPGLPGLDPDVVPPRRHMGRWVALVSAWLFAAALLGWVLGHIVASTYECRSQSSACHFRWDKVIASTGVAILAALAVVPGVLWMVFKARTAARARLGSIVAAADRRALWGALFTLLALASLITLPRWRSLPGHVTRGAMPVILVGCACAGAIMVLLFVLEVRASRAWVGRKFGARVVPKEFVDALRRPREGRLEPFFPAILPLLDRWERKAQASS